MQTRLSFRLNNVRHCAPSVPLSSAWSESANTCQGPLLTEQCQEAGGQCVTAQEGFYTISGLWLTFGALWFVWIWRAVRQLQTFSPGDWRVLNRPAGGEPGAGDNMREKFRYFYFSVRNEEERETK